MDSCLNTSIAHLHALAPQPCDAIPSPPSSPASRLHHSRSISPEWIERKGMEERAQCKQSIREGNLFRSTTSANRWPMQLHTNRRNSPSVPDTITKRNTPQQTADIAVPRRRVGTKPITDATSSHFQTQIQTANGQTRPRAASETAKTTRGRALSGISK